MFFSIYTKDKKEIDNLKIKILNIDSKFKFIDFKDIKFKKVQYLFVFGGDGTFLKIINDFIDFDINIILINSGRLGFLSSINDINELKLNQKNFSKISYLKLMINDKNLSAINEIIINFKKLEKFDFYLNERLFKQIYCSKINLINNIGSTGVSRSYNYPIILNDNKQYLIHFSLEPIYYYYKPLLQPIILDFSKETTLKFLNNIQCELCIDNNYFLFETNCIKIKLVESQAKIFNIDNLDLFIKKINALF